MKNKNFFSDSLLFFIQVLILIFACVFLATLITFPLWALADNFPKIYTIIFLSVIFLWIFVEIFKACKKSNPLNCIKIFLTILFLALGLFLFAKNIIEENRIFAFVFLILALVLSILTHKILNRFIKDEK